MGWLALKVWIIWRQARSAWAAYAAAWVQATPVVADAVEDVGQRDLGGVPARACLLLVLMGVTGHRCGPLRIRTSRMTVYQGRWCRSQACGGRLGSGAGRSCGTLLLHRV